jgi:hypothetical protein
MPDDKRAPLALPEEDLIVRQQPPPEEVFYDDRRGPSGCAWGVLGGMGCMTIPIIALVFVIVSGINSVAGVVDSITGIFNPSEIVYETVSTTLILERIQDLSQLTTTRFNFSNLVRVKRDLPTILRALYTDRLQMVIVGHVTAGIDLAQMTEANFTQNGDILVIQLPAPQLQDCFLNEQESYVVDRDTGLFTTGSPELDGQARQFAVSEFRDAALEQGILAEVNEQAQINLESFLNSLPLDPSLSGFRILTTSPPTNPPLPQTCG